MQQFFRHSIQPSLFLSPLTGTETYKPTAEVKHRGRAVVAPTGDRDDMTNSDDNTRPKRTIVIPVRYKPTMTIVGHCLGRHKQLKIQV